MAFAGTGKTSTLIDFTKVRPETKFLILMFNKAAVEEAKDKFSKDNVICKTVHGLAYQYMIKHYPKPQKFLGKEIYPSEIAKMVGNPLGFQKFQFPALVQETLKRFMASADDHVSIIHTPLHIKVKSRNGGGYEAKPLSDEQRRASN